MNALPKTLLLGLCITLAACQSAGQDEAPQSTQLSITTPAQTGLEYAQLLAGNGPWAHAERVQLDKQGLHLLDKAGNTLAEHSGRFEGLDHRLDRRGCCWPPWSASASRRC